MIDFYYWPTPNGWKVSIALEEFGLPYETKLVNIGKGDQFTPEFLAISPNNRMPAIVDHDVKGDPISVFESGAILWYLAEKTGQFLPTDPIARKEVMEWLFWQTGNQGPMAGQHSHFFNYAPDDVRKQGYAFERYKGETERCLSVLERRLQGPWVLIAKAMGLALDPVPRVKDWRARIKARPAVQRGVNLAKNDRPNQRHDSASRKILFGQGGSQP